MSGTQIVTELLLATEAVTELVPAGQIKAGALADDAPLPSLLVRSISEVERLKLKRVGTVRITERVEVVVRSASYRQTTALRQLVRDTCAGRTGDASGFVGISILNAGAGPDLIGPNRTYERGQDFRVSFEIPA